MRPIPGHSGYFATDEGGILSTKRKGIRKLKGYINTDGYLTVTVTADDGIKRKTLVHRLVVSAYKGGPPFDGAVVRHLNGNPLDNSSRNLEWGTVFDNYMDAVKHGTRANGRGIGRNITPVEVVRGIREDALNGMSDKKLSAKYGVSASQACRIRNRKRWAHII